MKENFDLQAQINMINPNLPPHVYQEAVSDVMRAHDDYMRQLRQEAEEGKENNADFAKRTKEA